MTQISLATSLHLSHGEIASNLDATDRLQMLEFVPVGLLCLKAYADQFDLGTDIRVTELNSLINAGIIPNDNKFYEHVVNAILRPGDECVGLMTDADSLHHTLIIAERIKRKRPNTAVCLGGPAASPISALIMSKFPFIDFVVRGEGEETFVDLICCLQGKKAPGEIPGLTWRNGSSVVTNGPRHLERNLDQLPVPAFEAFDMTGGAPLYLDVGRGCPFVCQFCATAPFWKRQYRMKSIERICRELCLIRDRYGRNRVNFSHDIFTCDRSWTLEFCDHLIRSQIGVTWTCSTRTDIIDPEVLERMAAAGCEEIYYGIETGSPKLQKEIDKNLDLDRAREIVQTTARFGIRPVTGFIIGYPMETYETLRDTLMRFFEYLALGGYRAHIFVLTPFPESPMYRDYGVECLDRMAEYCDLNLNEDLTRLGEQLKTGSPDIFSSAFRYATPNLQERLVDAAEELSAPLSMLRSLWPHLLRKYESPLDFYERWVTWIEGFNRARRPDISHPHMAGAVELLCFVEEEMKRLQLSTDDPFCDLVRYEKLKLEARDLPVSPNVKMVNTGCVLKADTVLRRHAHYLVSEFECDLEALLGKNPVRGHGIGRRWIAVVKVAPNLLNTISLTSWAVRILEAAGDALRTDELIGKVFRGNDAAATLEFDSCMNTIKELVHVGLLTVADAR